MLIILSFVLLFWFLSYLSRNSEHFVFIVIGFCFGIGFSEANPKISYSDLAYEKEVARTQQFIYTLKQDSSVSGSFFLGSGSINNNVAYYYGVKTDKGFRILSVEDTETNPVYILEDGGAQPYIETVKSVRDYKGLGTIGWTYTNFFPINYKSTTLHVPKGTIKINFSIGG